MDHNPAVLDDKGNAFVLTLPHAIDVAADGRPVWAPVDVVEAQATVKLVAMAALDEHVYQMVSLTNPAAYPLLEGRVRSYRGGSYVGDSKLTHQGVGRAVRHSLGIDEELKVERKTLDDKDIAAGFLSSTKHILRGYRTTVTNRAAGSETVELRESIPVSKIDDVEGRARQADDGRLQAGRRARVPDLVAQPHQGDGATPTSATPSTSRTTGRSPDAEASGLLLPLLSDLLLPLAVQLDPLRSSRFFQTSD